MATSPTSGMGQPLAAASAAITLHQANCEPMEISICRAMMMSETPQAASRIGAAAVATASTWPGMKKPGAANARMPSKSAREITTDNSRK